MADETGADGWLDYGWVMEVTFVVAIVVGAPVVALLSLAVAPADWSARLDFATGVGATVWLVLLAGAAVYDWRWRG